MEKSVSYRIILEKKNEHFYPLMRIGLLRRTVKSSPSSPEQQYIIAIAP